MAQTVVPFGFGVGDIFDVGKLIINLVARVRDSPEDHTNATLQEIHFSKFIDVLRDDQHHCFMTDTQRQQIAVQLVFGNALLQELRDVLQHHASLTAEPKWSASRLSWSHDKVEDIRARMVAFVVMMQPIYNAYIQQGAQRTVLQALDALRDEMKAGLRKTPSISTVSQHDDTTAVAEWQEIIQGLEQLGITSLMAITHKEMILRYFRNALDSGALVSGQSSMDSINPKVKLPAHLVPWIEDQYSQALTRHNQYHGQQVDWSNRVTIMLACWSSWLPKFKSLRSGCSLG
ncbi:uncharacterized protein CLAFUR5_08999 [Fulvia fulva]|uniref:Uncharacterized protein n=1 Tax=Passalora fulva TaxID=5499 RepID=A0A9Q8UTE0_PASFU|nr:uncharacterized protein CLAFUR5_08999 [Fulvia fulva]UJO21700.1 hypothetical protein CLAFUR5_08999 [Fulvia fulva]